MHLVNANRLAYATKSINIKM